MADTRQSNGAVNEFGYRNFALGGFSFARDEYFAHIGWPGGKPFDAGGPVPCAR